MGAQVGEEAVVREVVLHRDVRAPEILSAFTASRPYLVRRYASITCLLSIDVGALLLSCTLVGHASSAVWGRQTAFSPALLIAAAVALTLAFLANHLYGLREARRLLRRRMRAMVWFVAAVLIIGAATGWARTAPLVAATMLTLALSAVGRELFDLGLRVVFGLDPESRRMIIVGSDGAFGEFLAGGRLFGRAERSRILGIVHEAASAVRHTHNGSAPPILGLLPDIDRIIELWRPDELVVVDRDVELHHLGDLAELCQRRHMTLKLTDMEMRFSPSGVCLIPGLSEALFVASPSKPSGLAWLVKRCADIVVAATLLVVLSPLLAVVALLVKLSSPGPVFYSAERVGLGQRRFRCHKFRTMYEDAEQRQAALEELNEADGAIFKIPDDPRVTRVGRWLRAVSIDELPQLVNVLRGDMSLIGPRPLPLRDNQLLQPWHKQRHVVLPGLTGLWQVSGRSDTSFEEMIRLDLQYVDSWSLWLDLCIAWRSARAVAGRRGAY